MSYIFGTIITGMFGVLCVLIANTKKTSNYINDATQSALAILRDSQIRIEYIITEHVRNHS